MVNVTILKEFFVNQSKLFKPMTIILDPIYFVRKEILSKSDMVRLYFSRQIPSGKLFIEFDGILNDNLQGFYKTKCFNRNGLLEYAACTQFEVILVIKK